MAIYNAPTCNIDKSEMIKQNFMAFSVYNESYEFSAHFCKECGQYYIGDGLFTKDINNTDNKIIVADLVNRQCLREDSWLDHTEILSSRLVPKYTDEEAVEDFYKWQNEMLQSEKSH